MSRDDLEARLRSLREPVSEPPPFGRVWGAAQRRLEARRRRRRRVGGAAVLSAAAFVIAVLAVLPGSREPLREPGPALDSEVRELARSLSGWTGPLDFLLEPAEGRVSGLDPESPALRMPAYLSTLEIEEIL